MYSCEHGSSAIGMTRYFLHQHGGQRPTSEEMEFAGQKTTNKMSHDQGELLVLFETEHTMQPKKVTDLSKQVGVDAIDMMRPGSCSWSHIDRAQISSCAPLV